MGERENLGSMGEKQGGHPVDVYPRFDLSEEKFREVIISIKDKIPEDEVGYLDLSIIEAHLDELLFLGKLEELDKIVKGGRGQIGKFVDTILKKILDKSVDRSDDFQNSLREILNELETDSEINAFMSRFTGQRFAEEMNRQWNSRLEIWTHSHFMTVMTRVISDKFTKNENVDQRQLKSVGTLFFDLDGLKFLNEINGYNAGDKALWVMARALTDSSLISWAERMGIELVPSHHHGDEFLMGVIADDEIDLTNNNSEFVGVDGQKVKGISLMKYIGDYISNAVNSFGQDDTEKGERRRELASGYAVSGSMGDIKKYKKDKRKNRVNSPKNIKEIIDFSKAEQLEKLAEFKAQLPVELVELLDKNFKYQLSCSYGYSTLEDAMAKNVKDGLEFDNLDVSYEYLVYKLTGNGLVDSSEAKLKVAKELGRAMRRQSNDLRLRLLERLYRFGREAGGDDKNFKKLYLQVSRDLMKLEMALKELVDSQKQQLIEQEHREALGMNKNIDSINKTIRSFQEANRRMDDIKIDNDNETIKLLKKDNEQNIERLRKEMNDIKKGE